MSNGLILLVIVAIWAVYLLQHWVRRRENLATARSVDRFSEAMRVLERRRTEPRPVPAPVRAMTDDRDDRPTTPTVSVKPPRTSLRAGATMKYDEPSSLAGHRGSEHASDQKVSVGNRFFRAAGAMTPARLKAGALLAAGVFFVASVLLTPFGVTPWWTPLLALVAVAGVVAWLRSSVIRDAQAADAPAPAAPRAAVRRSEAATAGRVQRPQAQRSQERRPQPRREAPAATGLETPSAGAPGSSTAVGAVAAEETVYDVTAFDPQPVATQADQATQAEQPVAEQADQSQQVVEPGGWAPVAVPPPTYTLKARVDRPLPEPAATVDAEPPAQQSAAQRYADTPVEDLPFDGMALDEDLEDLPPVHRAG